jgi:hypothetical protein
MSNNISLKEQELVDKTLIDSGLPQNKLSTLIALAREKLSCDSECQQKRLTEDYKTKWELAKKQFSEGPEQIERTEKNYYIYDKGYPAYKDMLYDRYSKTAEEFKDSSNKKYTKTNEELTDMIYNYDTSTTYLSRMNELLLVNMKANEHLKREIDNYINYTQTNGRKVIYEDRERDSLTTIRKIILFFYYSILIYYIVFGKFIPNKEYEQTRILICIFIYIIFPFYILDNVVKLMFSLVNYIKSWELKKNVYKNL